MDRPFAENPNPEPEIGSPLSWKEIPMTPTHPNGQVRKTLASQLDRLDAILDTLGEGLNEAVATAVEQAVETAVRRRGRKWPGQDRLGKANPSAPGEARPDPRCPLASAGSA